MNKQYTEIEELEQKHDHHHLHIKRSGLSSTLKDFQTQGTP